MNYRKELETAKPIDYGMSLFEIEKSDGEYEVFHVVKSKNFLYVGSMSNAGFSCAAHMQRDRDFTLHENLECLYEILCNSVASNSDVSGELIY